MGFSPLANMKRRIPDGGRSNPRQSAVTGFGIHHNAGVDAYGEATNPSREVSANYWITDDGTILPNVDETRRAWTSGHAGHPAGAQADHRNITVEVSNSPEGVRSGSWAISAAAMSSLIRLIADVYKRYNLGAVKRGGSRGVGVHQDWVPTACPGPYVMGKLGHIISEAEKLRAKGGTPKPPPAGSSKTTAQLADEVLAGKHGNGEARKRSLGARYAAVQTEVDRRLNAAKPVKKPAKKPSAPIKSVGKLADEVLAGKHGNGAARRKSLGGRYNAVQAEVNRRLAAKKPAKKSVAQVATEVRRGDWGNGQDRVNRLRAAGYDAAAVQREVNRQLG